MKAEEARESLDAADAYGDALEEAVERYVRRRFQYQAVDNRKGRWTRGVQWWRVERAIDAYGDARALQAHVEACGKRDLMREVKKDRGKDRVFYGYHGNPCGDGWYCKRGKELADDD